MRRVRGQSHRLPLPLHHLRRLQGKAAAAFIRARRSFEAFPQHGAVSAGVLQADHPEEPQPDLRVQVRGQVRD